VEGDVGAILTDAIADNHRTRTPTFIQRPGISTPRIS
jgi:hypothetical protein